MWYAIGSFVAAICLALAGSASATGYCPGIETYEKAWSYSRNDVLACLADGEAGSRDINLPNDHGQRLLEIALRSNIEADLIERILQLGADISLPDTEWVIFRSRWLGPLISKTEKTCADSRLS